MAWFILSGPAALWNLEVTSWVVTNKNYLSYVVEGLSWADLVAMYVGRMK